MEKESAYPSPQGNPPQPAGAPLPAGAPQPAPGGTQSTPYSIPVPKPPSVWNSFKGGLDSVKRYKKPGLSSQEWADIKLTRQQWLEKYPGSTLGDYRNWYQSVQKRKRDQPNNWLQKTLWPLNKLIPSIR